MPESSLRPLRVACLIDSLQTGGAERLMVTFAEEAARRKDLAIEVFSLSNTPHPFAEDIRAAGVPLHELGGRSLVDPIRFLRLLMALRRFRPDVIHAHLTASIILGRAAATILRRPFFATVHNVKPSTTRVTGPRQRLYRHALSASSTRRIAVGASVAAAAAPEACGRKFTVVPNAVPPEALWRDDDRASARAELDLPEDAIAVIAVGALIGQKAYPDMLRAFVRAARGDSRLRLLIVGAHLWPDIVTQIETIAADAGLGERVSLLGMRRDIPRLLAASDIFLSASHWEGAPVSLLEAMLNGLPCVVTDVGDNAVTLQGTGARIAPPADVDGLADALLSLAGDPDQRVAIGRASRDKAVSVFGAERWVDRLLDLYGKDAPDARRVYSVRTA